MAAVASAAAGNNLKGEAWEGAPVHGGGCHLLACLDWALSPLRSLPSATHRTAGARLPDSSHPAGDCPAHPSTGSAFPSWGAPSLRGSAGRWFGYQRLFSPDGERPRGAASYAACPCGSGDPRNGSISSPCHCVSQFWHHQHGYHSWPCPRGAPPSLRPLKPPPLIFSSLSSWGTCWGLLGRELEGLVWLLPPLLWRCLVYPPFSRA